MGVVWHNHSKEIYILSSVLTRYLAEIGVGEIDKYTGKRTLGEYTVCGVCVCVCV